MAYTAILVLRGWSVLYVVLCPRLNYALYRGLLFHPIKFDGQNAGSAPELAGVKGENVSFKNSLGNTLHGWYYVKPNSKYTILISHGNGGNVSYRADTCSVLLNAGASVLIYDYRGYGRSEGLPTVEGICDDALHAYDFSIMRAASPRIA